ncbi:hypothetical protein NMG60_11031616 [Bertholletia excelsa]
MATNSLQSLRHHRLLRRRHSIDCPRPTVSRLFLKPTTGSSLSQSLSSTSFSLSSLSSATTTTTTPSTSQPISFDLLQQHLVAKNYRQADEETRRLLIVLAGEAAQKRGYVFFSEVQFIPEADLKAIDELWRQYSDNKFGYSIQRRIWKKVNRDFTRFFLKVGWMKKLDTEIEQYNYRSFPTEFMWEMTEETPEGHLPLTNALRGTQLLNSILSHPAFEEGEGDEDGEGEEEEEQGSGKAGLTKDLKGSSSKPLSKRVFKPDYSL